MPKTLIYIHQSSQLSSQFSCKFCLCCLFVNSPALRVFRCTLRSICYTRSGPIGCMQPYTYYHTKSWIFCVCLQNTVSAPIDLQEQHVLGRWESSPQTLEPLKHKIKIRSVSPALLIMFNFHRFLSSKALWKPPSLHYAEHGTSIGTTRAGGLLFLAITKRDALDFLMCLLYWISMRNISKKQNKKSNKCEEDSK